MTTAELNNETVARVFEQVADVLFKSGRAEIDGFGTFELLKRKARRARNPRTGDPIDLPAKVVVKFKPARALKQHAEHLPDVPKA